MAWLCWYGQRGIVWSEDEIGILPDAEKPDFRDKSGSGDTALSICVESRVRRSTAATGE